MGNLPTTPDAARVHTGRPYLWLGLTLGLLGPVLYATQLRAGRLFMPWYLPILGTAGAGLILVALVRARGLGRILALLVLGLLATGEWALLSFSKLPIYAGPIAVGQPFPAFTAARADGSPLSQADLPGEQNTVMVFYRGRW